MWLIVVIVYAITGSITTLDTFLIVLVLTIFPWVLSLKSLAADTISGL